MDEATSGESQRRGALRRWGFRIVVLVIALVFVGSAISVLDAVFTFYYTMKMREERTHFAGVPMLQIPNDIWVMQEIISEIAPDFVVETGTFMGGSAFFYASVLDRIGGDGKVITVDIEPRVQKANEFELFRKRVEVIRGDSVSPEVIERIRRQVEGRKVLVTLDSLHTREHVSKELALYAPFVSVGSYIVVQDTFLRGLHEAIEEFIETHDDFEIDRNRERYRFTKFSSGFLKRIRGSTPRPHRSEQRRDVSSR